MIHRAAPTAGSGRPEQGDRHSVGGPRVVQAPSLPETLPAHEGAEPTPTAVQRAGAEQATTTGEPEAQEGGEEILAMTPDTDELARRVYAEIRRRISVEWERIRRRS